MAQGQIQADAARQSGDIWNNAIGNVAGIASGAIKQEQDRKAQEAVRLATSPNYPSATHAVPGTAAAEAEAQPDPGEDHIASILNSLDPAQRPQAEASIQAVQASRLKVDEARQKYEEEHRKLAQEAQDHWFGVAVGLEPHLKDPDGGIGAANLGLSLSQGVPGAEQFGKLAKDAARAYTQAPDEQSKAQIADAFRQQAGALIQHGKEGGSLEAQKKWADIQKPPELMSVAPGASVINKAQPGAGAVFTAPKEAKSPDLQEVDLNVGGKKVKGTFDKTAGKYFYQGKEIAEPQSWVDPKSTADRLVKVEHMDPETGKTVIEWLPQSEVRGQKFEKGLGTTEMNRANMADTVNRIGKDIIAKMSDPKYAAQVGPVLGRYNNLTEFIGNPPPEFAELAGEIESYSLASMGVHGMRNVRGAEKIASMMTGKHTPEAIIAAIKGLNSFSAEYLQIVGRKSAGGATAPAGGADTKKKNPFRK